VSTRSKCCAKRDSPTRRFGGSRLTSDSQRHAQPSDGQAPESDEEHNESLGRAGGDPLDVDGASLT
jgi:hypothetical protein